MWTSISGLPFCQHYFLLIFEDTGYSKTKTIPNTILQYYCHPHLPSTYFNSSGFVLYLPCTHHNLRPFSTRESTLYSSFILNFFFLESLVLTERFHKSSAALCIGSTKYSSDDSFKMFLVFCSCR